jgi:hypothetical protein
MQTLLFAIVVGTGATVLIDLLAIVRKRLFNVPMPNYGLVGRWMAYMPHGKFRHDPIGATPPVKGEQIIGWSAHYVIGIAYAGLLLAWVGNEWIEHPTLAPALAVGVATVAAPFLLMQPGMGSGIAGARTASPVATRMHSLIMHSVFGLGLYLTALAVSFLST